LNWVLLRFILGDPQRFEFLWEKQVAKSSRKGGEAVAVACLSGLLLTYFFNSAAGIVAVRVASAFAIAVATTSPASAM
jgi:hypothetical protein